MMRLMTVVQIYPPWRGVAARVSGCLRMRFLRVAPKRSWRMYFLTTGLSQQLLKQISKRVKCRNLWHPAFAVGFRTLEMLPGHLWQCCHNERLCRVYLQAFYTSSKDHRLYQNLLVRHRRGPWLGSLCTFGTDRHQELVLCIGHPLCCCNGIVIQKSSEPIFLSKVGHLQQTLKYEIRWLGFLE